MPKYVCKSLLVTVKNVRQIKVLENFSTCRQDRNYEKQIPEGNIRNNRSKFSENF